MDIQINVQGSHELAGQIYRALRLRILDGRLAAGERLPSTRDLAAQLGVSRKTTLEVFERLTAEGYLHARQGDGTFVAAGLTRRPDEQGHTARASATGIWETLPHTLAMPRPGSMLSYDFMGGVTDKSQFPFAVWRRYINQALRTQAHSRGAYRDPAGEQELRLAISRYLGFNRALPSNWQDVIVTQGAQQALDLLGRVLISPGDVVAVEDPGYPPARASFATQGARIAAVPVDEQGIIVAQIPDAARLVYVTPSHQFPLGMPMSLERRIALLDWARQRDAVIIEDDYDGEYRFEGRPLDTLKSLDQAGLVAYVGTFSKTLFPDLRIGYLVPPASLQSALCKAKQLADWHGCTLTQTALANFILNGDFSKHLRRMHKQYTARRALLHAMLQDELAPWLAPQAAVAGIHLVAKFKMPLDVPALIAAARDVDVGLYSTSNFYFQQAPEPGLLFGYAGLGVAEIRIGLSRLGELLRKVANV